MITEKQIEEAYKEYYKAYEECSKIEDNFMDLKNKFDDAKENSNTQITLRSKLGKLQIQLTKTRRSLRIAASQIDKIRMLLDLAYIQKANQ